MNKVNRVFRVGTDCSGIDAPIFALNKIKKLKNLNIEHVFSSEIDKHCVKSIQANHNPNILYSDITTRNNSDIPNIDLYVCGFPCQPFSLLGSRKGKQDKRCLFQYCLDVIKEKKPKHFVLENVEGLLSIDEGKTFENIIFSLEALNIYKIYWKVLNTKDYGIPQNRKRIYIVGTTESFSWPKEKKSKNISSYIDHTDNSKDVLPKRAEKSGLLNRIPKDSVFIDLSTQGNTSFPNSNKIAPCIMRKSDFYCVPKQRRANIKELLSLQGFPNNFKQVVSNTQMKMQIGNSMSVNVLTEIFKNLIN